MRRRQPELGRRLLVGATSLLFALTVVPSAHAAAATSSNQAPAVQTDPGAGLPLGSMYHVVDQIGARALWEDGITGKGVNIALIDTGVAPVPSLMNGDKVIAAGRADDPAFVVPEYVSLPRGAAGAPGGEVVTTWSPAHP